MLKQLMLAAACVALLGLSACGDEAPDAKDGTSSETTPPGRVDDDKPSEATQRAEVIERLEDAFQHLDTQALKAIWHPEEQAMLDQYILDQFGDLQANGGSWTATPGEMIEADGFHILHLEYVINPGNGEPLETQQRRVALVPHEGGMVLRFQR